MNSFSSEAMLQTITLAKQSIEKGGGPFAAIIIKNNEIIARGHNQVTLNCDPTAHAEIMAIRHACQQLKTFQLDGCTLYTSSEPCPMCLSAIYWAGIQQVVYANSCQEAAQSGFDDSFIYRQLALDHALKSIDIYQFEDKAVLQKAKSIFTLWQDKEDKILY